MGKGKKKSPLPNNGRAKSPGLAQPTKTKQLRKKAGVQGHRGASNSQANNQATLQRSPRSSPTDSAGKGSIADAAGLSFATQSNKPTPPSINNNNRHVTMNEQLSSHQDANHASAAVGISTKASPPAPTTVYRRKSYVSKLENGAREDTRPLWLDLESSRDRETLPPPVGAILPELPHLVRVDVRVEVPVCDCGEDFTKDLIKHMFQQAQAVDETVTFFPWERKKAIGPRPRLPAITSLEEFPLHFSRLRQYMPRMWFPKKITQRWTLHTAIWIGSSMHWKEIEGNIHSWLSSHQIRWFERTLQVENTEFVGWLLYSTESMDVRQLQNAINEKLESLQVEVRRRFISTSPTDKRDTQQEHQLAEETKALYIVAEDSCKQEAQSMLQDIYSPTATDFPLGYKLRLIPEFKGLLDKKSRDNFKRASHIQKNFQRRMVPLVNRELSVVNTEVREIMMQLRSPSAPQDPLFHCVDFVRGEDPRAVFVVHPDDESAARKIHSGIIPFLRYHRRPKMHARGDYWATVAPLSREEHQFMVREIYDWFNPEAVAKFLSIDWDPNEQCCVTKEASVLEETIEADSRFDFADTPNDGAPSNTQTMARLIDSTPPTCPQILPSPTVYNDSISTFGTAGTGRPPFHGPSPKQSFASRKIPWQVGQASIVSRSAVSNNIPIPHGHSQSMTGPRFHSHPRDHYSAASNLEEDQVLEEIRKEKEAHEKLCAAYRKAHKKKIKAMQKKLASTRLSEATEDGTTP